MIADFCHVSFYLLKSVGLPVLPHGHSKRGALDSVVFVRTAIVHIFLNNHLE